jgi:hypothetical protein
VHIRTATSPRLRRLELRGQPDEHSLVAEAAKEVHADRQAALQICALCACGLS